MTARELRRRFARLAGLLEVADAEFMGIRDQISEYRAYVSETIKTAPEAVLVDEDSLRTLATSSSIVRRLDEQLADLIGVPVMDVPRAHVWELPWFKKLGLTTIKAVETALEQNADQFVPFSSRLIKQWKLRFPPLSGVAPGISFLYLAYFLLAQLGSASEIENLFQEVDFRPAGLSLETLAQELIDAAHPS